MGFGLISAMYKSIIALFKIFTGGVMKKIRLLLLCGVLSIFAYDAKTAPDKIYDGIVAIVNGEIITREDLEERVRLAIMSMGGNIPREVLPKIRQEVLQEMCIERLQWCLTEKYVSFTPNKCWVTQDEVEQAIRSIARRGNTTFDEFKRILKEYKVSMACLEKRIRCNRAWIAFIQSKYGNSVKVSSTELAKLREDYYKHKNEKIYYVQRIFVPSASKNDDSSALIQINNINAILKRGVPFEEVARQFSRGIEAQRGGSLGWVYAEQLGIDERNAIQNMEIGNVSTVKTNRGYVILKLKGKRISNADSRTLVKFVQIAVPIQDYPRDQVRQYMQGLISQFGTASALVKGAQGKAYVSDVSSGALDEINPQLTKVLGNMQAGGISPIFEVNGAFVVVCLLDRTIQKITPPSDEDFENRAMDKKMSSLSDRDVQFLKKIAVIEIKHNDI